MSGASCLFWEGMASWLGNTIGVEGRSATRPSAALRWIQRETSTTTTLCCCFHHTPGPEETAVSPE